MRRLFAALLVLAAAILLPSPVAATPPGLRVMALGDSLTVGFGSQVGGFRAELGRLLDAAGAHVEWTASSGAHSGWTVQDLRAGVDAWMAADVPDVVLLLVGTNNAGGVAPGMAGFEPAYLDLVARILADSPTVEVYVGMVPYSVATWAPNEVGVNIAVIHASWTSPRVHLVDLSVLPPCLLWDGVHPADDGYAVLGRQWYRALAAVEGLPAIPPDPVRAAARRPGYERAATDGSC